MLAGTAYGSQGPGTPPAGDELEARGAVIGRIAVNRDNVFDTSLPTEDNWLYRLANRWHILTREAVIRQQLLIGSGDAYSQRLVDESERLLRRNRYLYDARIEPVRVQDGVVDLRVTTRDVWTLMPGVSLSRSGGENRARLSVSESNLLGRGMRVKFAYTDDVDRESTSFEFNDNNLGDSWVSMSAYVADNSDGESRQLRIERPFYALDSRWSGASRGLMTTPKPGFTISATKWPSIVKSTSSSAHSAACRPACRTAGYDAGPPALRSMTANFSKRRCPGCRNYCRQIAVSCTRSSVSSYSKIISKPPATATTSTAPRISISARAWAPVSAMRQTVPAPIATRSSSA